MSFQAQSRNGIGKSSLLVTKELGSSSYLGPNVKTLMGMACWTRDELCSGYVPHRSQAQ